MKRYLLFTLLVVIHTYTAQAYTTVRMQDPQKTWVSFQSKLDTAVISIKPKGAYFECGLYLTFSVGPNISNYSYYNSDTFEMQLFFDLPEGSFVNDSWLWVGNQIVQASIIDRGRAQMIYEGIVNRRKDPSILYKNSNTQYELRVFPVDKNEKRKVKITYMVPANWSNGRASCPLPLNILKASVQAPHVEVLSYTDADWSAPVITEVPGTVFQPVQGQQFTRAVIPSSNVTNLTGINYSLLSPMQNGMYTALYQTGPNQGYYQMVMMPLQAAGINLKRKTAFLFDYEGNSTTAPAAVLAKTRQILLDNYQPTDSFNLMFSQLSIYQYSNTWLPCDSATINTVFNALNLQNPMSAYSNLPSLINAGIGFINGTGRQGDMILFSNTDNFSTISAANQLITDLLAAMGPTRIPVHVVDFQDANVSYVWSNGTYYYGNDYFNSNIAALTGGIYETVRLQNYYYYNSSYTRTLSETTDDLMQQVQGSINGFDSYLTATNGFCYGSYDNAPLGILPINKPYIRVGRYTGTAPLQFHIAGNFQGTALSHDLTTGTTADADSFTKKMWIARFIESMESIANINSQQKGEIMDSSISNRVLSRYTAFLALEPSDTVKACDNCEDETNPGNTTAIDDLEDNTAIKAFP
ncbi:MAG TPA: VIT domain-containing protein, partial [Chitinophagales bacterium]|nr:VIT domain-containing protein [Chitinophagales bacterium]